MNNITQTTNTNWSNNRIIPAFQTPQHLNVYDIRSVPREEQLSITTIAGLINRPQPQIYLINNQDDLFWLQELCTSIPHHTPTVPNNAILDALLTTYRSSLQGMIIYNPDFIDSINIATTLAGQLDSITVSPTQAQALQQSPHKLPILADLRTHHWQTRLQAYHWAQQNLLHNASTQCIAGLQPHNFTGLRSFLVATRTFVYWLDSRNLRPDPTLNRLSEHRLMQNLFNALPPGATHLGWFIDEGSGVNLTSEAAKAVLATDHFHNLEVWTSVNAPINSPTITPITQQTGSPSFRGNATVVPSRGGGGREWWGDPCGRRWSGSLSPARMQTQQTSQIPPQQATIPAPKTYLSFTISDGDNLQYSQHRMLHLWHDPARGSLPIGWTISPVLPQAAPSMAAYYTRTATPNDELIAGPSGAGYIFPSRWPPQHLPAFLQRTGQLMQDCNLKHLQILDTTLLHRTGLGFLDWRGMRFTNKNLQQQFAQALAPFGVRGIFSGAAGLTKPNWTTTENISTYHNLGLATSIRKTISLIKAASSAQKKRPLFLNVYIMAWSMTPSDLKQVIAQLGSDYEVVTPGTLLAMIAASQ